MAMFLSGTFIGATTFGSVILPTAYSDITFNGECKIGVIHISNIEKDDTTLDAVDRESVPDWVDSTLLLATFDDSNTDAGNITGVASVDDWEVFRRRSDEASFTKLATLDGAEEDYIDYTVQANQSYKYQIYPISSNTVGNVLETDFVEADFYGWYLIDEDTDTVYKFELEVSTGGISTTTDSTFVNTQSKYPTQVINGDMQHDSGSISVLYESDCTDTEFNQSVDLLNELEDFINNGKEKILKSRKGHVWRVRTDNFSIRNFASEDIISQPYLITFNWREVAEVV